MGRQPVPLDVPVVAAPVPESSAFVDELVSLVSLDDAAPLVVLLPPVPELVPEPALDEPVLVVAAGGRQRP